MVAPNTPQKYSGPLRVIAVIVLLGVVVFDRLASFSPEYQGLGAAELGTILVAAVAFAIGVTIDQIRK